MSGRSFTRVFGRERSIVYAWSFSAMCVSIGYRRSVGGAMPANAEGHVHAEGLPEGFSCETGLGAKAEALIEHPVVLDLRMIGVGGHLEGEEVSEVTSCRFLELREHAFLGTNEP